MSVIMIDDAIDWLNEIKTSYGEPISTTDQETADRCTDLLRMLETQINTIRADNAALQAKVQKLNHSKLLYMHLASALFKELLTNEAEQTD